MVFSPDIVMRENVEMRNVENSEVVIEYVQEDVKTPQTTIPFVKNNNFDYSWLTSWMGRGATAGGWILFVLVVIFVVTATSNGANLTDGLDGLATGTSAIIGTALAIMAYLGANIIYSSYLNIMYIPGLRGTGGIHGRIHRRSRRIPLVQRISRTQVFMGDTGSLTIGGIIAVFAILIRKELLLPILCAIFFIEDLSVIIQVAYFKITKTLWRRAKGIQNDTPPPSFPETGWYRHGTHTETDAGYSGVENRDTVLIVGIMLAVITFVTSKIR